MPADVLTIEAPAPRPTVPDAMPEPGRPRTHVVYSPALDGLRALAIAAVLLYHGGVTWMPGGFLGVDIFFVLSGYLITGLLLAEHAATGGIDLKAFWLRRARRLLPAAFLAILLCLLLAAVFFPADLARTRGDGIASLLYVNNWHQVVANHSYFAAFGRPSLLAHLWSLAVEEQFYLLWPILLGGGLVLFGRARSLALTAALALLSTGFMAFLYHPGSDPSRVYYGTDTRAFELLAGAMLAFAWPLGRLRSEPARSARTVLDATALLALAAVLVALTSWHDYDRALYQGGMGGLALVTVVLIAAIVHPVCRVGRGFGAAPLRWIGQRSYGIYLYHWPIMVLSRPGTDIAASRWIVVPAQIALTVVVAAVSYRYLERPVRTGELPRRLKARWVLRPRGQRRALGGAAAVTLIGALVLVAARPTPPTAGAHLKSTHTLAAVRSLPATARGRLLGYQLPAGPPRSYSGPTLAIGASVMLSAANALHHRLGRGTIVDAAVGRQIEDVISRLRAYRDAGRLPERVIVQVGENGPLYSSDLARLRAVLQGVPRVVLINVRVPRSWEEESNQALDQLSARWPAAALADWHDASAGPGLTWDGAHPKPAGARVYARLAAQALGR
jgi:peptidoglycan/LPS O-acetylase OafA/YrhL